MSIEKLSPAAIPLVGGVAAISTEVDFIGVPREVNKYEIVTFVPTISHDLSVLSILWEFGDGKTSTELNVTHGYKHAGIYTVTLTVYLTDLTSIVERKYYYITVNDVEDTIPDLSDRASNLLIEQVKKQYGENRASPATSADIAPTHPISEEIVEVDPILDVSDRAVSLLIESVRKIYGTR